MVAYEISADRRKLVYRAGGGGEIGALARAFSGMSREVQEKAAALQQEVAQRQRIFDTSLDLILVVDRKGNFLQVSPSCKTILDYAPEDMVGRSAAYIILPEDLESTRNEMRALRPCDEQGHAHAGQGTHQEKPILSHCRRRLPRLS